MCVGPVSTPDLQLLRGSCSEENHFLRAWQRCVQLGSPLNGPRTQSIPTAEALLKLRQQHRELIETASPYLLTLQEAVASEPSYAVILLNNEGDVLDLLVDRRTAVSGARVNLVPGGSLAEKDIGNNGPGTALVTGRAICFSGFEHYNQTLLKWQTMGVPILTAGGRQIGALGVFLPRYSTERENAMSQLIVQTRLLGHAFRPSADTATRELPRKDTVPRSDQVRMAMRIMGGFAHEVRNPLAIIRGFAQLLLEGKATDQVNHYLSLIVEEVDRINERIRGFISLSSFEDGDYQKLDVRTLINDVDLLLQGYVFLNGVRLLVETEPGIGSVQGNAEQLRQVILNLVNNALESASAGGTVVLRAAGNEDEVRITVTDNGQGIAKETMPRVFEPFFSTRDGVGLGLAISEDIIHRHGGTIELESTPGQGTTATVTLPKSK